MTMHLDKTLSTINARRPKNRKLTKTDYYRLVEQHRQHNKRAKQTNNRHLIMSFYEYLDYIKPKARVSEVAGRHASQNHRPAQPYIRDGAKTTHNVPSHGITEDNCSKRETPVYSGELVTGICTMHKSNAVPVINDTQAKDIARMRRG